MVGKSYDSCHLEGSEKVKEGIENVMEERVLGLCFAQSAHK